MIFSPDKDIAKNEVLDLESVQTKIKETIANMVLSGSTKEEIQSVLSPLIYNYLKKIKVDDAAYKRKIEQSLLNLAQHQYFVLSNNMKTINSSLIKSMGGSYGIDLSNENASAKITQDKFRNFITKNKDTGTPLINRYENLVKEELKTLANQPAKVVSYNKNGKQITYTMSARNLAEMKIRYDANVEDVNKEKSKGTKLVWISSHSNCSPRCAPFQGRLYSLDGTKGTIAGHSYVPIEIAQAGKNGDGNGCTNGYNCRHYIIPTSEEELLGGQRPPTNYNNATIKKEQEIDAKQRMFENQIRKLKKEETNLRAGGFNDEAKKMNLKWKILEKKYQVYSLENHRSFSRWRTQISRDEEVYSNQWSKKQVQEVNLIVNEENKYQYQKAVEESRIIINEKVENNQTIFDTHLASANEFNTFEKGTGRYYRSNTRFNKNDTNQCEKVVNATLNIESNLKLKVPSFLSKKYEFELKTSDVRLSSPNRSSRKEGSACHIAVGHSEQYQTLDNIEYLNKKFENLNENDIKINVEDVGMLKRVKIWFDGEKYIDKKGKQKMKKHLIVMDYKDEVFELVTSYYESKKI